MVNWISPPLGCQFLCCRLSAVAGTALAPPALGGCCGVLQPDPGLSCAGLGLTDTARKNAAVTPLTARATVMNASSEIATHIFAYSFAPNYPQLQPAPVPAKARPGLDRMGAKLRSKPVANDFILRGAAFNRS